MPKYIDGDFIDCYIIEKGKLMNDMKLNQANLSSRSVHSMKMEKMLCRVMKVQHVK